MTQTLARPVLVLRLPQPRPLPRDESFGAFVHDRRQQLLRTALLLCAGAPERAEPAVQRALTRLYVTWPRIAAGAAPAFARRALVEAVGGNRPGARGTAAAPDRVLRALAELPAGMRAAVVLSCVERLGTAETADALGCARGTAAGQSALGLARLRRGLEGGGLMGGAAVPGPLPARRPFADVAELLRATARRLPVPPPGPPAVAADVRRGRAALARARRRTAGNPGAHR